MCVNYSNFSSYTLTMSNLAILFRVHLYVYELQSVLLVHFKDV